MTTRTLQPSINVMNRAKLDHSAPGDRLNRAKGGIHDDSFMGVHRPATIENAKVSELPVTSSGAAFSQILNQASDQRKPLAPEQMAKLEQSSATLVNQFFMGTMLKQMRQSPFKVDSLNGGKGGEAYAGLFDQHIAEHAGNRIAKSLVKSMVKEYARTAETKGIAS
jgi:hypothetical protein